MANNSEVIIPSSPSEQWSAKRSKVLLIPSTAQDSSTPEVVQHSHVRMLGLETWSMAVCTFVSRPGYIVNTVEGYGLIQKWHWRQCCEEALHTCSMMCEGKLLEAPLWPLILLGPLVKDEVGKVRYDKEVKAWMPSHATGTLNNSCGSDQEKTVVSLLFWRSNLTVLRIGMGYTER